VVRKVIRLEATEFRYKRGRQPLPRIDPWRAQLDELLLANEGKAARERLTLIRIFGQTHSSTRTALIVLSTARASSDNGTRCSLLVFIRRAGIAARGSAAT
jgi:hypothetical protein